MMMQFFEIILGLLILTLLVAIHELGHAFMARRSGVVVEEFAIGFPPKLWAKKLKNGIKFSLNCLFIGGFVKMQGEYDSASGKGDYGAAGFWGKTKILLGGVAANWFMAIILLTILALTGMPKILPNQFSVASDAKPINKPVMIVDLVKDHAAEEAGLKVGDSIIKFDGQDINTVEQLIGIINQNKGQVVSIDYQRDGRDYSLSLQLGVDAKSGILGVDLGQSQLIRSTWSAPIVGVATTAQFTWATIEGIGQLFSGLVSNGPQSVSGSVAGPIGIIGTIFPSAARSGLTQLVFLTAIVSLSLAVMNILPIPGLDGGRWLLMTIHKVINKKLSQRREENIQTVGVLILLALVVLVTVSDIGKLL